MSFIDCINLHNEEEKEDQVNELFEITNDATAEWAVEKIAFAREEHDRLVELAKSKIDALKETIASFDDRLESETGFLTDALRRYAETCSMKETKTQRLYKLVSGSLVFKNADRKIERTDDSALTEFLRTEHDEFVKVTYTPNWVEYKKRLKIVGDVVVDDVTGEVVEGVVVKDVPETFTVKI